LRYKYCFRIFLCGPFPGAFQGCDAERTTPLRRQRSGNGLEEQFINVTPAPILTGSKVTLATMGIGLDWGGFGYEALTETSVAEIVEVFPRLEMKGRFVARNWRAVSIAASFRLGADSGPLLSDNDHRNVITTSHKRGENVLSLFQGG
jgi:hypothetical protein